MNKIQARWRWLLCLCVSLLCCACPAFAQSPSASPAAVTATSSTATAHLDKTTVAIGQSLHLIVDLTVPTTSKTEPPAADTFSFDGFDVRDAVRTNQPEAPGLKRWQYDFQLVTWDAGKSTVPSIDLGNGAKTQPIAIEVSGATPKAGDDPKQPRDIKNPVSLPIPLLWIIIGALLVIALVGGLIWSGLQLLKRRREAPPPPPIPAHVWALQALDQLWARKLAEDGKFKEYYESLTAILRTYLERRFALPVMERTTAEVLADMRARNFSESLRQQVRDVLDLADLVKFARLKPGTEGPRAHWTQVKTIVESTIPAQPQQETLEKHLLHEGLQPK